MKKIGISSSLYNHDEKILRDYNVSGAATTYDNSFEHSLVFYLPCTKKSIMLAKEYIKEIDLLLLSGGSDICPSFYNQERLKKLSTTQRIRDLVEIALIDEAIKQGKPIFGICRGLQLLNVYFKGNLYQDLSYMKDSISHSQNEDARNPVHTVKFKKDSFFYNIYGKETLVNSLHHQGILTLGEDLIATGYSSDNLIEAIEHKSLKIRGVQWHPEILEDKTLFKALVEDL